MDWISTDPSRPGVFAIGQEAYGVFALGQLATGVVAVGQVARGVIAIGQGAVGVVAIGQGAIGIGYAAAMLGIGGRGFGGVLKLLPKITIQRFDRPPLPATAPLRDLTRGELAEGFVLARIEQTDDGAGLLTVDGRPLPAEPLDSLTTALREAAARGDSHACVRISARDEIKDEEPGGYRRPSQRERVLAAHGLTSWREGPPRARLDGKLVGAGGLLLRAIAMAGALLVYWLLAGADVAALFVASDE